MRSDIDFPGPLYPSLSDQIASEPVLFLAGAVGVAVFSWGLANFSWMLANVLARMLSGLYSRVRRRVKNSEK
ncbi:hypothetical protein BTQ07_18170 [Escherichia coli]|nr:hypothetical protein BU64_16975 [Escherichia coli O128:H2 str. 2011C-3317]KYS32845.1 hypothetical protein AML23_27010 [Escherichia coli]KYS52453.1 hypothetical protein AML26_06315 [Escherichia coli]KYW19943.1 hypothetical protein AMK92_26870 [Escherichia coli]PAU26575.1 hypothetical protein BTQ07_18170 [Escherichia coli]